jgi:RNA polymerase sigma-70 factor (ECF subfamily)
LADVAPIEPDPMLRQAILECRDKLPAKPRQALDARLEGGDEDRTLAERLGMQLNTFLQNFARARKLLAECLGKRGIEVGR